MKRIFLSLLIVPFLSAATAQTAWDGLQFSQNYYGGTARFTAMGGAFAALGGDFASLSVNPAGIGVFRSWELMFTPAVSYNITDAKYLGNTDSDSYTAFGLDNLGIVFGTYNNNSESMPVIFNFGIGYNKLSQFMNRTTVSGRSTNSSITSAFAEATDGTNPNILNGDDAFKKANWTSVLAWDTWLIDFLENSDNQYIGAAENLAGTDIFLGGPVEQFYYQETGGSVGEYVLSFGGNVADQFYFGMNLGVQTIWRNVSRSFTETAVSSGNFDTGFKSLTHDSEVETRGEGYNVKLGFIWRPIDALRLGAYFHSPTWMFLTDRFSERMNSKFDATSTDPAETFFSETPVGEFEYRVTTPLKWGAGLAYVIENIALLSFDYEGLDYSSVRMAGYDGRRYTKLEYPGNEYRFEDDFSKSKFGLVTNIRAGVEVRLDPVALRAGYAYYGSPIKNNDSFARNIFSVGLGFRVDNFYIDGVYSFAFTGGEYTLYNGSPEMITDSSLGKVAVTMGFRF